MAQLSFTSLRFLDKLFVQSGYVLDFTNATFAEFFESEVGVDIYDPQYEAQGTSKGNRLRTFLKVSDGRTVARALRALWEYRSTMSAPADGTDYESRIMKIIGELSPADQSQTAAPLPIGPLPALNRQAICAESAIVAVTALASYAHQEDAYNARVLAVIQRLRNDGIDCWSDHFVPFPREGWPRWMQREIAERRWILVFASEAYKRRADGKEEPGRGLGVIWEHGLIRGELYEAGKINERFIPVGFGPLQRDYVPSDLREYTYFDLESAADYQKLLGVLRGEPLVKPHPLGRSAPPVAAPLALNKTAGETAQHDVEDDDDESSITLAERSTHLYTDESPRVGEPPLRSKSSTVFFDDRFSQAFPGVRGIGWFTVPTATERLALLLHPPLVLRSKGGEYSPIWFWGRGNMPIHKFSAEPYKFALLDVLELIVEEVAAVYSPDYHHKFVYVKAGPARPTGLYENAGIEELVRLRGYADEEVGLYNGRYITRAEYDDGAAVIDGSPVDVRGSSHLRVRNLTPFNFIIAAQNSPINNHQFDFVLTEMLNGVLRGDRTLEEIAAAVQKLPRRSPLRYEM